MSDKETNVWEYYADPAPSFLRPENNETSLVDRLKNTGPIKDENDNWTGRFPSWQDAHEAAIRIERLERVVQEYEETIRYLTNQLSKTL